MPGKFVFPGGRVEISDRLMPIAAPLHARDTARLMQRVKRPSAAKAAAYALAAIRETYEETGLMLGARAAGPIAAPAGRLAGVRRRRASCPISSAIHFVARAITPPNRPRRFDSRFFAADISAVAHRAEGFVGPDAELVELVWMPITEARRLDIPAHHRDRARRAAGPHRRRHEPRPSGAVLPHAAQALRARTSFNRASQAFGIS